MITAHPTRAIVARNSSYLISGASAPCTTSWVHFDKAGTAAGDYSIVRPVSPDANGNWQRSFLATTDDRFYVSRKPGEPVAGHTTYLVQAR